MADFEDDEDFDQYPEGEGPAKEKFNADLERQIAELPPSFYESMQPLLLLCGLANFRLMSNEYDPVPRALAGLLDYSLADVQEIHAVKDVRGLAHLLARRSYQLFDFLLIGRLMFEGELGETLCFDLRRETLKDEPNAEVDVMLPRRYVLEAAEGMLENAANYLAGDDADRREELRMRRLQTESVFARLADTLRLYYLPGQSPAELQAAQLDELDEVEDGGPVAVYVTLNDAQRATLGTALQLPTLLVNLGETPFGRALAGVERFREKALKRLANRLALSTPDEPFALAWSEMLRLYQAAQVCAISTVADVLAVGSLEDVLLDSRLKDSIEPKSKDQLAESVRHVRELMTMIMTGFIEVVEANHPDELDVQTAREEIGQLAELLT